MPQCHCIPMKWQAFFFFSPERRCGASAAEATCERTRRVSRFIIAGGDRQIDREKERETEREKRKIRVKSSEHNWWNIYYTIPHVGDVKNKNKKNEAKRKRPVYPDNIVRVSLRERDVGEMDDTLEIKVASSEKTKYHSGMVGHFAVRCPLCGYTTVNRC